MLNGLNDDIAFNNGVEWILEQYYDDSGNVSKEYEEFAKNIDERAKELLEDYSNAAEERCNDTKLDYNPKTILVDFSSDSSDEYINEVVSELSESTYIINSNIDIDTTLSADKIDAIEKAERERKTKTVIVNLGKGESTEKAIKNANECQNVKIAVIDTGADLSHEDMNGRYDLPNCVDVTGDSIVKLSTLNKPYVYFHGTAVSGIINARVNNSIGVAGIGDLSNNFSCRVMAIQAATYERVGEARSG